MNIYAYYKALGLPPDASLEDARRAYRKLVNRWHPDRFARNNALHQLAEEHLKLFNVAYAEVTKYLAARPYGYTPRYTAASRGWKSDKIATVIRKRGAMGSGGAPAVLNRLTRKFRQVLSSFLYSPRRPARIRKDSGSRSAARDSNPNGKARPRQKDNHRKNFDEIFNEVAGPEAATIKKAAALNKKGRPKRASGRKLPPRPVKPVSIKFRRGTSSVVTPISRVKKVGKIRRL
jgi:curved DNA-binding protein CbpA